MLSRIGRRRREFILAGIAPERPRVLEIGAFDNATFRRDIEDDVRYVDVFSSEELREMHRTNPRRNFAAMVEVDYVVKEADFARRIDARFDLVVANHVVEHIPDLIFWFDQLASLLVDGGAVALAVPDRRYTFDYYRPESLATQMIRAHAEKLDKPDKWQLVEHFYYHFKVDTAQIWQGAAPGPFVPRFSLAEALRRAEAKSATYTDAHCWVFTPTSFVACVADLRSAGMLPFEVAALQEPEPGSNEFRVILKKT